MALLPMAALKASFRRACSAAATNFSQRGAATAAKGLLESLPSRKLLSVSGPDAAPLLQSLVTQDLLHFAPLLGAEALAALSPSGSPGPLTRLQVKNSERPKETDVLSFPPPPHAFTLRTCSSTSSTSTSSSGSSSDLLQLRLWRRPAVAASFLNAKGRVLADAILLWRDSPSGFPRFLLDLDASISERTLVYIERHAVTLKVFTSIENGLRALQLLPPPREALSIPQDLPYRRPLFSVPNSSLYEPLAVVRVPSQGPPAYRLVEAPPLTREGDANDAAAAAGAAAAAAEAAAAAGGPGEGLIAADPRTWRLGFRVYLHSTQGQQQQQQQQQQTEGPPLPLQRQQSPGPAAPAAGENQSSPPPAAAPPPGAAAAAAPAGAAPATAAASASAAAAAAAAEPWPPGKVYSLYRHLCGVCEGPSEVGVAQQLPLFLNFDWLRVACMHNKGCFIGQEVLTRALHQLVARRRIALLLEAAYWPHGAPSRASSLTSAHLGAPTQGPPEDSLEASAPLRVVGWWQEALRGATDKLIRGPPAPSPPEPWGPPGGPPVVPVAPGDLVCTQRDLPGGGGLAVQWVEIGNVLLFDNETGAGLCIVKSKPGEGDLKNPQGLLRHTAGLAGAPVRVFKGKPAQITVGEPSEAEAKLTDFVVVPPPYVLDFMLGEDRQSHDAERPYPIPSNPSTF